MTEDCSAGAVGSSDSGDSYDAGTAYTVDQIVRMYSVGGSVWLATQLSEKTTFQTWGSSMTFKEGTDYTINENGCWVFNKLAPNGYPTCRTRSGKKMNAHRWSYLDAYGTLPSELDHECNNKGCINPEHLRPIDHASNIARATQRDTCPSGHPWTEENTYTRSGTQQRRCRVCNRYRKNWKMSDYYDMDGKPIDQETWAVLFNSDERIIGVDVIEKGLYTSRISTVWLGLDHSFSSHGPPIIFETMVFGGPHDQEQWRYATKEEAAEGHKMVVELVRGI